MMHVFVPRLNWNVRRCMSLRVRVSARMLHAGRARSCKKLLRILREAFRAAL